MSDIDIRREGLAGRITLNRPKALNAVTWGMIQSIAAALEDWRADDTVGLIIIDAAGEKAFAAGGDIVDLYHKSRAGDLAFGRRFWAEEYRLNLALAEYPKPVVTMMQGFTMGGGVGISCHASHRIVDESVQIAMPECAIGLIPDVGGTFLLANAPGHLGAFLGLTGYRMGPDDAIFSGFADSFVPRTAWPDLVERLCKTGDAGEIETRTGTPPNGHLRTWPEIDLCFGKKTVVEMLASLNVSDAENASKWLKLLEKNSPLAVVTAHQAIEAARGLSLRSAFQLEYRFVWRAVEHSDFLEGIRAAVIDKDRTPNWKHDSIGEVTSDEAARMLMPLGADELKFEEETS